jgi:hypothetical protein
MGYDPRCYDLAEVFLADEPALQTEHKKSALAQTIQEAIEDWIGWEHDHAAQEPLPTAADVHGILKE